MCRRNQLLGVALAGFGLGLLAACFFESGFFCCCVGITILLVGFAFLKKK